MTEIDGNAMLYQRNFTRWSQSLAGRRDSVAAAIDALQPELRAQVLGNLADGKALAMADKAVIAQAATHLASLEDAGARMAHETLGKLRDTQEKFGRWATGAIARDKDAFLQGYKLALDKSAGHLQQSFANIAERVQKGLPPLSAEAAPASGAAATWLERTLGARPKLKAAGIAGGLVLGGYAAYELLREKNRDPNTFGRGA
jgi:hypothetical protein